MKSILLLATLAIFTLQNPVSKVSWDKDEHDFGQLTYDQPIMATFVLTNISDDSIKLDNVRTSCGCTSSIWTDDYIMPGDTSHIVIEYDAHDRGEFFREIKVFIHKQKKAERLYVFGSVEQE